MPELELRVLRALVALADEAVMSRAALALHISQPALSKQLAAAERTTGLTLFERHAKGVTPTPAGRRLVDRARVVLREADALTAEVSRARHEVTGRLRVGYVAQTLNERTRALLQGFVERHPGVAVDKRQYDLRELTAGLLTDETEVALLRLPLSAAGLTHEPVFAEPRVAVLPCGHSRAGAGQLTVGELLDEPWVVNATTDPAFRDYSLAVKQRDGRPPVLGPTVNTVDEFLEAVVSEQAIGLAPASAARYYARPGVVYVPVTDAEPSVCSLSWRTSRPLSPAAQALVDLVRRRLPSG